MQGWRHMTVQEAPGESWPTRALQVTWGSAVVQGVPSDAVACSREGFERSEHQGGRMRQRRNGHRNCPSPGDWRSVV